MIPDDARSKDSPHSEQARTILKVFSAVCVAAGGAIAAAAQKDLLPPWAVVVGLFIIVVPALYIAGLAAHRHWRAWRSDRLRRRLEFQYRDEIAGALARLADLYDGSYTYSFGPLTQTIVESRLLHPDVLQGHSAHGHSLAMWIRGLERRVARGQLDSLEALHDGHQSLAAFLSMCRGLVPPLEAAKQSLPDKVASPDMVRRVLRSYDEFRTVAQSRADELVRLSQAIDRQLPSPRLPLHHLALPPIL